MALELMNNPLADTACERCAHVRAVHAGGCAEGPCTACPSESDCDAYVGPEQVLSDPLGVLHAPIPAPGVNQPTPSTVLGRNER